MEYVNRNIRYVKSFKPGTGPDYVQTVSCLLGNYRLVVDFYRDIDGAITTSMSIDGGKLKDGLVLGLAYDIDVHLLAEAMRHMSEIATLMEHEDHCEVSIRPIRRADQDDLLAALV